MLRRGSTARTSTTASTSSAPHSPEPSPGRSPPSPSTFGGERLAATLARLRTDRSAAVARVRAPLHPSPPTPAAPGLTRMMQTQAPRKDTELEAALRSLETDTPVAAPAPTQQPHRASPLPAGLLLSAGGSQPTPPWERDRRPITSSASRPDDHVMCGVDGGGSAFEYLTLESRPGSTAAAASAPAAAAAADPIDQLYESFVETGDLVRGVVWPWVPCPFTSERRQTFTPPSELQGSYSRACS